MANGTFSLMHNEDCSHYFAGVGQEDLTVDAAQRFVDRYADTTVSHMFFNCTSVRTAYPSDGWESYVGIDPELEDPYLNDGQRAWLRGFQLLQQRGVDIYKVWIDRCRERGISPWLSMRMNDLHLVHQHQHPMNNTFWRDNPQCWRTPDSLEDEGYMPVRCEERAFDFAHEAVRAHHMRALEDMLEHFDPDGIELDWMRFPFHFRVGHERQGGEILTQFMRDVRALIQQWSQRRGHPIGVAVRTPSHPVNARELGIDGLRWAHERLIDILTPTPFWFSSDFDIPIELWTELLGPDRDKIALAGGVELTLRWRRILERGSYVDIAGARGQIMAAMDRGADAAYTFNLMSHYVNGKFVGPAPSWKEDEYAGLLNSADPDVLAASPRRHIVTFDDTVPPGVPLRCALPAPFNGTEPAAFRIYTGPPPSSGKATIRVGLADAPGVNDVTLKVRFNSRYCEPIEDIAICDPLEQRPGAVAFPDAARGVQFAVPLDCMNHGYNVVELIQPHGAAGHAVMGVDIFIEP